MSGAGSGSVLDGVQRSFGWLVCDPAPLALDCDGVPGLPQRSVPLGELRDLLLSEVTSGPARDVVWRRLVGHARTDGPAWVVGAVGMALPGLRRQARLLSGVGRQVSGEVEADLVDGFYRRLATVPLEPSRVCGRLLDAAVRAVLAARATDLALLPAVPVFDGFVSAPPPQPWGHPDIVLQRAIAAAVIDRDESVLVGRTYLEDVPLAVVARQLGVSAAVARVWRRKAVHRLVSALRAGELDPACLLRPAGHPASGRRAGDMALVPVGAAAR